MANCKSCGNKSCGGDCKKACIKVYRPVIWRGGQTGIDGDDGDEGDGIVNIVDNEDGTMTIFISDGSDYTIILPVSAGKFVTEILPVVGDDTQWELVYDDATTLIIPSAFYLVNQGAGVQLIYNQAAHPTWIRSLGVKDANNKIVVALNPAVNEIEFNVKQYGKSEIISFVDNTGAGSYVTLFSPRYENAAGLVSIVTAANSPLVVENNVTDIYELDILPIDAYKAVVNFRIQHSFRISYDENTYNAAIKGRFHFFFDFGLTALGTLPNNIFDQTNGPGLDLIQKFQQNNGVCFYDFYRASETIDIDNKLRRFGDHKTCEVFQVTCNNVGSPDYAGWNPNSRLDGLGFRFPYIDDLVVPAGPGADATEDYTFETRGSIILHLKTDTDFLSTVTGVKNH